MTRTLQIFNLLGFVLVILLNTLANTLPINGLNTGEISAMYPNFFTPAGLTFSIWGLIYLLLLGFVIYQAKDWVKRESAPIPEVKEIGWWFFVSCLANASWILAWHHLYVGLSLLIMLLILGSLIVIYLRLDLALRKVNTATRLLIQVPFSVYLGWISVATIANTTIWFSSGLDWNGGGLGEANWAAIMVGVAAILGLLMTWVRRDIPYSLVIIWALIGILLVELGRQDPSTGLRVSLYTSFVVLALGIGGRLLKKA